MHNNLKKGEHACMNWLKGSIDVEQLAGINIRITVAVKQEIHMQADDPMISRLSWQVYIQARMRREQVC